VGKLGLAFKSMFSRSGWRLLHLACLNRSVVPLFKLQSLGLRNRVPGPTTVSVEVTNRCNLNCVMCVRRFWDPTANPLGEMTFDFFQKHVLCHLKPYQVVNLQCVGESLLNKDFLRMLSACKALGCLATFTTNGVLLRRFAEGIVAEGADEICVSADGIESTKKWRQVEFRKVLDGIDAINEAKRRQKREAPFVAVNCVLTRDSLRELPQLVEMLGQRGVGRITLLHLIAYELSQRDQSVIPVYQDAEPSLREALAAAKKHRVELILPPAPGEKARCRQPFRALFINWDGDVRPCCMSTFNEGGALWVGNVARTPLPELWNSGYMRSLRRALDKDEDLPVMCEPCPMRRCDLETHTHLVLPPTPRSSESADSPGRNSPAWS
jgi:MoaA/NifB/PqqE/SkfB family radical SAM enzyme